MAWVCKETLDLAFSPEPEDTPEDIERFKYYRRFMEIHESIGIPSPTEPYVLSFNQMLEDCAAWMLAHGRLKENAGPHDVLDEWAFINGFTKERLEKKGCKFELRFPGAPRGYTKDTDYGIELSTNEVEK